ncbi:glycine-rich cell wall structural protein 1.0-like [Miscanthus floridulus]|uniref:glycine-rich cell wall structural protein 1.0-like n=1 Tax=Miscanthus floridulus TaxID=154761 RepID=UPI00345AA6A7
MAARARGWGGWLVPAGHFRQRARPAEGAGARGREGGARRRGRGSGWGGLGARRCGGRRCCCVWRERGGARGGARGREVAPAEALQRRAGGAAGAGCTEARCGGWRRGGQRAAMWQARGACGGRGHRRLKIGFGGRGEGGLLDTACLIQGDMDEDEVQD